MRISLTKPKSISDILFLEPTKNCYHMLDTKRGVIVGKMSVQERQDLYIEFFDINPNERRKGYGTIFLNFAKTLSEKLGLGGNLRVLAGATESGKEIPPHVFYRKNGFTTDNKKVLDRVDNAIRTGEKLDIISAPPVYMYFKK